MKTCTQPRVCLGVAPQQRPGASVAPGRRLSASRCNPALSAGCGIGTHSTWLRSRCRAEGGKNGQGEQQQSTQLAEEAKEKATEAAEGGEKTLGFVGNLIMWTLLSFLLGASLFFTTARSFLPNDMQPLDEGSMSDMR